LDRLLVPRVLATGSFVSAATVIRVGTNCLGLIAQRLPPLVRLALASSAATGEPGAAQAAFRDELIALVRDSAEVSWREMRRAVDDLDAFTRPREPDGQRLPSRRYRAKP
jgi:hypothetical protein